ncbi:hypothetical protein [Micromonospora zamorensis]|uniref:hypothetical protein n=1 Tax=Micromonospora zamorensis TaxID=709883 RepID=UPI0034060DAA
MSQSDDPCFYYLRWLLGGLCTVRLGGEIDVVLVHASNHLAHRHMNAVVQANSVEDPVVALIAAPVSAGEVVMHLNRLLAQSRYSQQVHIVFPDDWLYLELLNQILAPSLLPPIDR